MITFKPVVHAHRRRKDGTYPVTIRVTFGRKCRYLPTTITVTASDMTRGLKIKNPDTIAQCNALCDRLRAEASRLNPFELEGREVDWIVGKIRDALRAENFRLDFFVWADEYVATKSEGNRPKYITALRAFERFLGKREIDINDITHPLLVAFAETCDKGPKLAYYHKKGVVKESSKPRTGPISPQYLSRLSNIFNAAKDKFNDEDGGAVVIPRSPFRKLNMTPPPPSNPQRPLSVAEIQAMIDAEADKAQRRALDIFLVGFALMGANIADLWEAAPPKDGKWVYFRKKVRGRRADRGRVEVVIPPEIRPYLARLGDGKGHVFWLPGVRLAGINPSAVGKSINQALGRWCRKNGIEPFTYYACRHSWGTLARKIGIEKATVDEGLGHVGDYKLADIYAARDWERIAEANRRVLALFRWPNVDS